MKRSKGTGTVSIEGSKQPLHRHAWMAAAARWLSMERLQEDGAVGRCQHKLMPQMFSSCAFFSAVLNHKKCQFITKLRNCIENCDNSGYPGISFEFLLLNAADVGVASGMPMESMASYAA
jgi:hypothetical protein